jgi:hypothetical protein
VGCVNYVSQVATGSFFAANENDVAASVNGVAYFFQNQGLGILSQPTQGFVAGPDSTMISTALKGSNGLNDLLVATSHGTAYLANGTGTASGTPATMISPAPSSTLTSSSVTFTWTPGTGVTEYELRLGTTGAGSSNLYTSGGTTATTETVSGLPTNGVTVYARLYSLINGSWQFTDYTYTEAGTPVPAALTSPAPGSVLAGSSVTFTWSAGTGVTEYELRLGTTGAGSSNLYNSGITTATTEAVSGLPTTGATVTATLYSLINGTWQSSDYTYTEQ